MRVPENLAAQIPEILAGSADPENLPVRSKRQRQYGLAKKPCTPVATSTSRILPITVCAE